MPSGSSGAVPLPQHCPTPAELDDLELLLTGALAPLDGFDVPGSAITLSLPEALREAAEIELVDPEGLPLAHAVLRADGSRGVRLLTLPQYGPFRRLYLSPAQVRAQHAGRTVVPVVDALTTADLADLRARGPLLLLALVGTGTPRLSPVALLRATLAAAALLPDAVVVAVPLAAHGDAATDHALGVQVVDTYAGGDPVHALTARPEEQDDLPDAVATIVAEDQPAPEDQGLVLFFTGLSGSGKSTLARALMDRLLEQGGRSVTSLDGDVVRRHLSAGLTFSKEDRETNIRRIGWVAAEIARHGGVAVVSPIAPFDATRQDVRGMVDAAGGAFFLVHVATPLEECERRDRKGLYAKARRGEIPEFTGISSPYEVPTDADVVVDTTGRTIDDALGDVVEALAEAGYLDLRRSDAAPAAAPVITASAPTATPATAAPEAQGPLKVLFVCTANICRSPYLELRARQLAASLGAAGAELEISSAGTHGWIDKPMEQRMAERARERGIDPDTFRSRRLSPAMVAQADLVLTAEATHRAFILEEDPQAFRKVFTLGQFAAALGAIDPGLSGHDAVRAVGRHRGSADPAHDLADPYGRGADAATATARRADDLLDVVLPRLSARGAERTL